VLLSWFVKNYIRKCAEKAQVPVLSAYYSSADEVEKAMNDIIG